MASGGAEEEEFETPDIVVPGNPTTWRMDLLENQGWWIFILILSL